MRRNSRRALRIAAALAALVAAAVAGPPSAEARLAHSKFSELLRDSELICRGQVAHVSLDQRGRGHVTIEVVAVLKGARPDGLIRIEYSGEVHDMVMDRSGEERLLFLKRVDGRWTGTHYGRSYWWLVPAADDATGPVTPVKYPLTMLRFHGPHRRLLRPARLGPGVDPTAPASQGVVRIEKMIPLSAVENAVAAAAKAPGRPDTR